MSPAGKTRTSSPTARPTPRPPTSCKKRDTVSLSAADKPVFGPAGPPPRVRARQHSRVVRLLRWGLPLIMVAVIGVLAGLIGAHALKRNGAGQDQVSQIKMTNPRF